MDDGINRRRFLKWTGTASAVGLAGCAGQQGGGNGNGNGTGNGGGGSGYPNRRLTYIVPFSQGGGTDTYARQIMPQLSEVLGTQIRIENIPGAASLRGAGRLFRAEPNGYTFGGFNPPSTPLSAMINPPDWEMPKLEGVCAYARTPYMIIANPQRNIQGMQDLVNRYRSGEFTTIGGQQKGGILHVMAIIMKNRYNMPWENYVGYTGSGPTSQAVASNEVPVGLGTDTGVLSTVEGGRADVVACTSSQGSSVFPDAPTVTSAGFENIDFVGQLTRCMFMPPGTPDSKIQTVSEGVSEALESEEVQQWSEETGNIVEYHGADYANDILENTFETIPEEVNLERFRD